jgi:hypothetical protein
MLSNMGARPGSRQQYFTFASTIAVINSVVGGSAAAIAAGAFGAGLAAATGIGGAAATVSLVVLLRLQARLLGDHAGQTRALFPSRRRASHP